MAEYIECEALLHKIKWASSPEECVMTVRRMPAADVAPIRHGAWKPLDRYLEDAKCSECGEEYIVTEDKSSVELFDEFCRMYRFCPNCGARMDKEENDETD